MQCDISPYFSPYSMPDAQLNILKKKDLGSCLAPSLSSCVVLDWLLNKLLDFGLPLQWWDSYTSHKVILCANEINHMKLGATTICNFLKKWFYWRTSEGQRSAWIYLRSPGSSCSTFRARTLAPCPSSFQKPMLPSPGASPDKPVSWEFN